MRKIPRTAKKHVVLLPINYFKLGSLQKLIINRYYWILMQLYNYYRNRMFGSVSTELMRNLVTLEIRVFALSSICSG